jgi:ligand-binding sensor domain-containing protein
MQCPKCHHENREGAELCEECGARLDVSESRHPLKKGTWWTYDATDGLPGGPNCLLQDRQGYLWLGTGAGFCRYDGTEFITYTTADGLADNSVQALCEDSQGRLWIGSAVWFGAEGGLSCFDGNRFTTYTAADGLTDNRVWAICEDSQGRLWIGTLNGLFCFDGHGFTTYTTADGLADNQVRAICEDGQGRLWIGAGGGISCFDGKRFTTYTTTDGLPDNGVRAICEDGQGRLWIGTHSRGVFCFDGQQFTIYTSDDGLVGKQSSVVAVCEDHHGRLWFGGWDGVSCFDGSRFTNYTAADGLWANGVFDIMEDREGQMWFAHGQMVGLSCFDEETIQLLTDQSATWVADQDKSGRIWFNSQNDIYGIRLDSTSSEVEQRKISFDIGMIGLMVDSGDHLWISLGPGDVGIYRYDSTDVAWESAGGESLYEPRHFKVSDERHKNYAVPLLEVKDGTIWFNVSSRLCRFHPERFMDEDLIEFIDVNPGIDCLIEDRQGRLWIGGQTIKGLICRDGSKLTTYTQENGLSSAHVRSLLEDDDGNIWIGTEHGLCCYDGKQFINFSEGRRLKDLFHWDSVKDIFDHLWFATRGGGIYRTDGQHFQWLTEEDGLSSNLVVGLLPQTDGSMIICTGRGIVSYRPTATVPPQVEIREVMADQVYRDPTALELTTTDVDLLTISYHSSSLATRRMRYSYILEGHDEEWRETWETQVRYENVPVGEYTFKVIAINRDLVCSETPATLKLTVIPDPRDQRITELESELEEIHGKFEPIPNPYMAGGPVRGREMFFGREEHFRFVSNKLKTEREGIVIVLYGQRRSGKTSLLHQIRNGRLGEDFMPVLIDMQEMAVRSEVEFYERITEEIAFELMEWVDINAAEYDYRGEGENPTLVFRRFIDAIMEKRDSNREGEPPVKPGAYPASSIQHSVSRTLLLMFDEYELLEEKIDEGILSSNTLTFLAGILERYPRISFVFTGSRHIERRNPQYWSILLGKSAAQRISLLSERDTLRLIREPVADVVKYQRAVPQRIYRLTGGQPFYTQHVCQLMIERLNQLEKYTVHADDVEETALELVDNPPPQMMYFWSEELAGKEKLALVMLGRILDRPDDYAPASMVAEYASSREEDIKLEASEIAHILDGLCQYELLERERVSEEAYEYRYKIDLFRYWVRRNQSIGQVMREMDEAN